MSDISRVIRILKKESKSFANAAITEIGHESHDPFQVLISCIMSLRTRDIVTYPVTKKLFSVASTPEQISDMPLKKLENIIRPVNFYKTKSKRIKQISKEIIEKHSGKVPSNFEELMKFNGVGRKTANIVMVYGHGSRSHIPVDVHVHRIPNRLGWVHTKKPEQTEEELKKIVPKRYWMDINDIFVQFGQNICLPRNPKCSVCPVNKYCKYAKTLIQT
ncbi:MAG: endonuclease III, partial [Candidatus Aenigmarchaeota archaeon]|nr:endonuclease III [Candidatus Aenigmarchaeota archaeon]